MSESQSEKKTSRFRDAIAARWSLLERWLLDGSEVVGTHDPEDLKADAQWAAGQQQARALFRRELAQDKGQVEPLVAAVEFIAHERMAEMLKVEASPVVVGALGGAN